MAGLPLRDESGNALTEFRTITESWLSTLDRRVPLAASFVVVAAGGRVRELREETGIESVGLDFAGVAEFELRSPPRREYVAVYRTEPWAVPRLIVNDEAADFLWWDPRSPVRRA